MNDGESDAIIVAREVATPSLRAVQQAPRRTAAAWLFGVVLAVYLASATYSGTASVDVFSAAVPSWKVATEGTLDVSDASEYVISAFRDFGQATEIDGGLYSNRNPGVIAFGVPFYAVARVISPAGSEFSLWPQGLAGAIAAAGAVLAVFLAMDRIAPRMPALLGTLVFAFGTGTWSVSADGLWGHGPTQLFLALGVLAMANGRNALAGLGFGAALTVRPYSGFAAASAGLYQSLARRTPSPAVAIGLTSAIGLAAFMLYTRLVFGIWSVYGGYTGRAYLDQNVESAQGLLNLPTDIFWSLVHPAHGLLIYSPFLIVLLAGLPAAWRQAPPWVRSAFLGGSAFFLAQLYANTWNAGDSFFGYRYPLEFLTMAAPMGLLAYVHGVHSRPLLRRFFPYAAAISVALHFAGAVLEPY